MRTYIINFFAVTGSWMCLKAIALADRGHIEFEVEVPAQQPVSLYYENQYRPKRSWGLILFSVFLTSLMVWSVLTVAFSIEDSHNHNFVLEKQFRF